MLVSSQSMTINSTGKSFGGGAIKLMVALASPGVTAVMTGAPGKVGVV